MRIGFIGTGNFALQHAQIITNLDYKIVGCYGTNQAKNLFFSQQFDCKIYADYEQLISKSNIDILYIVIPPFAHDGKYELRAIEQDIPFFTEKPVGLDFEICQKISHKIDLSNHIVSVGYHLRYEPILDNIKSILAQNIISNVRICQFSYMPEVYWWRRKELSGGILVDSHYIDLLRYLFGDINYVSAIGSKGIMNEQLADNNLNDSIEALIKFDSGVIASFGANQLLNNIQARKDLLEIYGDNFVLYLDLYKLRYKNKAEIIYKQSGDKIWQTLAFKTDKQTLLTIENQAFINAVEQNDINLIKTQYHDALTTLKWSLEIERSATLHN